MLDKLVKNFKLEVVTKPKLPNHNTKHLHAGKRRRTLRLLVLFAVIYLVSTLSLGVFFFREELGIVAAGVIPCAADPVVCAADTTAVSLQVSLVAENPREKVIEITAQDFESGYEDLKMEFNGNGTWENVEAYYGTGSSDLEFLEGDNGYDEVVIRLTLKDAVVYEFLGTDFRGPFSIKFSAINGNAIETSSQEQVELTNLVFEHPYSDTSYTLDTEQMSNIFADAYEYYVSVVKQPDSTCIYPKMLYWELDQEGGSALTGEVDPGYSFQGGNCAAGFGIDITSANFTPGNSYQLRVRVLDYYNAYYPSDSTWLEYSILSPLDVTTDISFNQTSEIVSLTIQENNFNNYDSINGIFWEVRDGSNNLVTSGSENAGSCCSYQVDLSGVGLNGGTTYSFRSRVEVLSEGYYPGPTDQDFYSEDFTTGGSPEVDPTIEFTQASSGKIKAGELRYEGTVSHPTNNISEFYLEWSGTFSGNLPVELVDGELNSNSEAFAQQLNFIGQPDGEITLTFTAVESGGRTATAVYTVEVVDDYSAPALTLSTFNPDPTTNRRPDWSGTATDSKSNITAIEYRIENNIAGEVVTWTTANITDGNLDSVQEDFTINPELDLPDGNNIILVRARDNLNNQVQEGNEAKDLVTINAVDSTAPDIVAQPVVPNPTSDPQPKLLASITDDTDDLTSNIASIYYQVDGGAWQEASAVDGNLNDETNETINITLTGLALGSHTAVVRAVDAAGNDTNSQTKNASISFTMVAQDPDLPASKFTKSEEFLTHNDHDTALSNAVWGNGKLHLRSTVELTRTSVNSSNLADRYATYGGENNILKSRFGGFWADRKTNYFLYVDANNNVTTFDVSNIVAGNHEIRALKEVYNGSRTHLWVLTGDYIFVYDLNNTPANQGDDQVLNLSEHADFTGKNGYFILVPDIRNAANYGMFIYDKYDYVVNDPYVRLTYVRLQGSFTNPHDDSVYTFAGDEAIRYGGITNMKFGPEGKLWITKDGDGNLLTWNDNGTPTNEADDVIVDRGIERTFDVAWDSQGRALTCGSTSGLNVILSDNGTPSNPADDTISQLLASSQMQGFACSNIHFLPGQNEVVGDQIFYSVHSNGFLFQLFTNNSYQDKLDDQLLKHDLTGGNYPADKPGIFIDDYNRLYANIARYGTFRLDLTRGFEEQNIAVSKTDAQIEGRLFADFVSLKQLTLLGNIGAAASGGPTALALPQGVQIQVTNDGGLSWYDIDDVTTVNFPTDDYRVRYRVVLNRLSDGSSPVIDSLSFDYSAYLNQGSVLFNNYFPSFIQTTALVSQPFSIVIEARDQLGNLFPDNSTVSLALRRVGESSNLTGLNITSAQVVDGRITVNGLTFPTAGTYQLFVTSGSVSGLSTNTLSLTTEADGGSVVPVPSISFTANKYNIVKGEEVELRWSSANINQAEILGLGEVAVNGTLIVKPDVTTRYQIQGDGQYGKVSSSLEIAVSEAEVQPGLIKDLEATTDRNEIFLGEKFVLAWKSTNALYVMLAGREARFAPEGDLAIYPNTTGDYKSKVRAFFADGSTLEEELTVKVKSRPNSGINPEQEIIIPDQILGQGAILLAAASLTLLAFQWPLFELARSLNHLGVIFGVLFAKKRKYWGIIYDLEASEPVPFAVARVYKNGEFVAESVSDLKGRYAVLLEKAGYYELEVSAPEFKVYRKQVKVDSQHEVVEDVALTRLAATLSFFKRLRYNLQAGNYRQLRLVLLALMVLGFLYTCYATYVSPVTINFSLLAVYVAVLLVNLVLNLRLWEKFAGKVVEKRNNKSVPGAIVRVYDASKQVDVVLTNSKGLLKLNLPAKVYDFTVNKEGYEHLVEKPAVSIEYLEAIQLAKNGYLQKNLYLKKSRRRTSSKETVKSGIANPFAE